MLFGVADKESAMNEPNLKDLLSISEAAKMVGVSPATLRRWDRSGKLKAIKHPISNFRLYRREDLQAFLRLLRAPASAGLRLNHPRAR